jgi:ABC transporter
VRFDQAAFRYGRRAPWVLHDVTLTVPRGRIIEVNGRNGAGKSTLLRLIAGVVPPGRGGVTGRPPAVGYAPERFPAEQPFTARAYLGHMATVRGVPPTRIDEWAERLGFTDLLDTRLPDLSKGSAHKAGLISPGRSILVLIGVYVADLLLGLGPLRILTVPMIEWMGAAGRSPSAFTGALPWFALRTLAWAALAIAVYARLRRTRP